MSNRETVYKLLYKDEEGRLLSVWVRDCKKVRVEYFEGESVTAKVPGSPLMAFRDLETAREWVHKFNLNAEEKARLVLYEARAEVWDRGDRLIHATGLDELRSEKRLKAFWKRIREGLPVVGRFRRSCAPEGTVFCESIELVQELSTIDSEATQEEHE